jgi:uncharacterized protein (DUF2147 family)
MSRSGEGGTFVNARRIVLRTFVLAVFALACVGAQGQAQPSTALQAAVGQWQVIDDEGKPGGHVETYLVDGRLFGKVTESRPERPPDEACTKCQGELKDKPVLGMVVIRDFRPDGNRWVGGTVLDPQNGKNYKGKIWAVGENQLRLRGYVGLPLLGRSETWLRLR